MRTLALLLAFASTALAEGPFPRKERKVYAANKNILAVNRSLSLSYLSSRLYYNEPSANTGVPVPTDYLDYEEGVLRGGKLAASWMTEDQWYFHGEWAGAEGKIDYTGYTGALKPITATSRATTQDYGIRFGKGFNTGERWMLTPLFGLGGRHWTRVIAMGDPFSYTESYDHYFFNFGGMAQWAPWDRLVATADAAIGGTFRPSIQEGPGNADLGTAPILKFGFELDGRVSPSFHIFSGFDYTSFEYGHSSPFVGSFGFAVFEPDSKTQALNFNFGLRYSFNALAS